MRNNTVKKFVAGAMATAMAVGCSVSAMAATPSGSATGTGTKLDHVKQDVVNVVFPVVPANSEQFNYTVDAEGLIQAADSNYKGAEVKLPGSSDSHVYFISKARVDVYNPATLTTDFEAGTQYYTKDADAYEQVASGAEFDSNTDYYTTSDGGSTYTKETSLTEFASGTVYYTLKQPTYTAVGANDAYNSGTDYYTMTPGVAEYSNSSTELEVTNKSNIAVYVSATAKATGSGTMTLVNSPAEAKGDEAKLYLGIRVGDDVQAVTTTGATAKQKVAGSPDNFELVSLANGKFEYQEKADAKEWYSTKISLVGAVNVVKDSGNANAPTVEITWTYSGGTVDPVTVVSGGTLNGTVITYTGDVTIKPNVASGVTVTSLDFERDGAYSSVSSTSTNYYQNASGVHLTKTWLDTKNNGFKIRLVLSSGDPIILTFNKG